jgi:hypothetical protein
MKSKARSRRYVVCVKNKNHPASLELRKLYAVLSDPGAEPHGLLRIVDEDGEDYLYPESYFVHVSLPAAAAQAVARAV